MKKPKILFYDIETTPLLAWVWSTGEQYIGHHQLHKDRNMWDIICITYCYNDGKPAKHIDFDYNKQDSKKLIQEFDKLVADADIVIGKNNKRFDDKMVNAIRMFHDLPCDASWIRYTGDLEKQMRKHFRLPSQSLDYISNKLGFGGKIPMVMQDWIDIVTRHPERGLKAFKKMIKYGKKDILDTRNLWNYLEKHFEPILHVGLLQDDEALRCRACGSEKLHYHDMRGTGLTMYYRYNCQDCGFRNKTTSKAPKKMS